MTHLSVTGNRMSSDGRKRYCQLLSWWSVTSLGLYKCGMSPCHALTYLSVTGNRMSGDRRKCYCQLLSRWSVTGLGLYKW